MRTLITIPFSHFSEKARWALDYAGLSYVEKDYFPGVHRIATKAHGGTTVPVLVTPHGSLKDSTDILAFVDRIVPDAGLFPKDEAVRKEVVDLEDVFDTKLGQRVITYGYSRAIHDIGRLSKIFGAKLTKREVVVFKTCFYVLRPLMIRGMKLGPARALKSLASIHEAFAAANERLVGGRQYLIGETLTAADITFAALAAPLVLPPGHPVYTSNLSLLTAEMERELGPLRETSAGEHVLRMYRDHRGKTNPRWS